MIQVWNLDDGDCCEYTGPIEVLDGPGPCIEVLYAGGSTGSLTDVGTMAEPITITTAIAAPVFGKQRSWLTAASAATPTLPASPVGPQIVEWYLAWANDDFPITLNTVSGLLLSGPWIGGFGSILYLQADGAGGWIEGSRNEI